MCVDGDSPYLLLPPYSALHPFSANLLYMTQRVSCRRWQINYKMNSNLIKLDSGKYQMPEEFILRGYEKWPASLKISSGNRFLRIWALIAKVQ